MATISPSPQRLRSGRTLQRAKSNPPPRRNSTKEDQQRPIFPSTPIRMEDIISTLPKTKSYDSSQEQTMEPQTPVPATAMLEENISPASKQGLEIKTRLSDIERAKEEYPFTADDPDPLTETVSKKEFGEHYAKLKDYSNSMFLMYQRTKSMRESLFWHDFVTAFRPHTIRSWSRATVSEWKALLEQRGISLDSSRDRAQVETVIDVLYWDSFQEPKRAEFQVIEKPKDPEKSNYQTPVTTRPVYRQPQRSPYFSRIQNTNMTRWNDDKEDPNVHEPGDNQVNTRPSQPDDGDDSSSSSDDDAGNSPKRNDKDQKENGRKQKREPDSDGPIPYDEDDITNTDSAKTAGDERQCVNNMVKAYAGQPKFSGAFLDDLEETIEAFETIADVCDVTSDRARKKAVPIMLKGAAFRQYSKKKDECASYDDTLAMLRTMFSSKERQTRLLKEWKAMRLTEFMAQDPDKSEMDIFKAFVDKATSLQHQLHSSYQDDRQLRDMLSIAVDLPRVQEMLSDRQPRTTHQLVERVANRLSHRPKTAGATMAFLSNSDINYSDQQEHCHDHWDNDAHYTLGQRYGGNARKNVKSFVRPNRGRSWHGNQRGHTRRPLPKWLQGVKGCMVCHGNHRANDHHSRSEVTAAVKRLKLNHPTAMLTSAEEAFITDMFQDNDSEHSQEYGLEVNHEDTEGANEPHQNSSENEDEHFGQLAYISMTDQGLLEESLSNSSFLHGMTIASTSTEMAVGMHVDKNETAEDKTMFGGVLLDTCCNRRSVMGNKQYEAYCDNFKIKPAIKPIRDKHMRGIGGKARAIGMVLIDIPFTKLNLIIPVTFLLVEGNQPALLSMRDMKQNGLELSIQKENVSYGSSTQPLLFENFFLKHKWGPNDFNFALYTENELRTIHRTFGHPSVSATEKLIRRAQPEGLDKPTRETISKIADTCNVCRRNQGPPRRFKLTIGMDELRFNHTVQIDTMFLSGRPVCHLVDEATHYCAATFLRTQSTRDIWKAVQSLWILTYLGPPDFLRVDQGSAYISKEMEASCAASGITLREAPIETPGSIGTVERYHAPLRKAYDKLRMDLPQDTTDAECLKMATYAVNCTIGPEGLCPTLLVFGALPRPIRTAPSPTQLQRAKCVDAAMVEVAKEQSRRRIAFGLKHKSGPKAKEVSAELEQLPAGSKVAVYRTKSKQWEGPHLFVSIDNETVVVQTSAGRKIFRSVCVRPWTSQNTDDAWDNSANDLEQTFLSYPARKPVGKSNPRDFVSSRKQEINGLIKNGTFCPVHASTIPKNTRIFGSRFVDELKKRAEGVRRKSRLIAQNYSDEAASEIATKAPTVQRFAQRLLLSLAASWKGSSTFTRDVTQAYVQSKTDLERPVYIKAPQEMELGTDFVLKVVRPLYGIPESGLHWYLTYLSHHQERLGMKRSSVDPCFLLRHDEDGNLDGAVILQVDDSLAIGSQQFLVDEAREALLFRSKDRVFLSNHAVSFNGIRIAQDDNGIWVNQKDKIDKLTIPDNQASFNSQRAASQYIGINCRPDVCANIQLIAPGATATTKDEYNTLRKAINYLKESKEMGLRFNKLDLTSVRIVILTDASFANTRASHSQLGYIVLMVDDNNRANIIHYGSNRCKRVTRSVMAAELHALILGFDFGFVVRKMLEEAINRPVQIEALLDSKTVFDVVAKNGRTTEKRLQIDVHALKQSCERGEIARIAWIPGPSNPADILTKLTTNKREKPTALTKLMTENTFAPKLIGWADTNSTFNLNTPSPCTSQLKDPSSTHHTQQPATSEHNHTPRNERSGTSNMSHTNSHRHPHDQRQLNSVAQPTDVLGQINFHNPSNAVYNLAQETDKPLPTNNAPATTSQQEHTLQAQMSQPQPHSNKDAFPTSPHKATTSQSTQPRTTTN